MSGVIIRAVIAGQHFSQLADQVPKTRREIAPEDRLLESEIIHIVLQEPNL
jgi:hypothetical protein